MLNYVRKLFQELILAVIASNFKVSENEDNSNINHLGVKNQWKQEWLQVKVGETYFSHCTHKIDRSGYALCIYCHCQISYGTNGKTTLMRHFLVLTKNTKTIKRPTLLTQSFLILGTIQQFRQKNLRDVNHAKLIVLTIWDCS